MNIYKSRLLSLLFLLILPLGFSSGCSQDLTDSYAVGSEPTRYQSRYPITLHRKEQVLDIPISSETKELSSSMRDKIASFATDFSSSSSSKLSILVPIGSPNSSVASGFSDKIITLLSGSSGTISRRHIEKQDYDAKHHKSGAPIRLSYNLITTSVKRCGEWGDLTEVSENTNYLNFGCATQNNLSVMIDNPSDLHTPRTFTDIDASRRFRVIDDYRNASEPNTPDSSYVPINRVEF